MERLILHQEPPMMSREDDEAIQHYIDQCYSYSPIVEIGTYKGLGTELISRYVMSTEIGNRLVITIDPFEDFVDKDPDWPTSVGHEKEARELLAGRENVKIIKGFAEDPEVSSQIGQISLLIIDGDHSYEAVEKHLKIYLPKTIEWCLVHDINYPEIERALRRTIAPRIIKRVTPTMGVIKC